jgi:hypothetical protein
MSVTQGPDLCSVGYGGFLAARHCQSHSNLRPFVRMHGYRDAIALDWQVIRWGIAGQGLLG